jgi:hypothetical protein
MRSQEACAYPLPPTRAVITSRPREYIFADLDDTRFGDQAAAAHDADRDRSNLVWKRYRCPVF